MATTEQSQRRSPPAHSPVRLLECDPELGLRIPVDRIARARDQLVAPVQTFRRGALELPFAGANRTSLGFLILDGLLARDVILARTASTELLGEGDVVQPWATLRDEKLVRFHASWRVLEPARIAVLEEGVSRAIGEWPQVMSALLERAIRRTHRMSIHQALLQLSPVETRLLVLFWYLAERWGHVTPAGVTLRLKLSHQLLGQLVGCGRPSVTTAMGHIAVSGRVVRRADGTWLLRSSPPDELSQVDWHEPGGSGDGDGGANGAGAGARATQS